MLSPNTHLKYLVLLYFLRGGFTEPTYSSSAFLPPCSQIQFTAFAFEIRIVRAAFAGTVAARYLDAGGTVRSGTPIISLIRPEDLWVRFAIPETQQARMRIGTAIIFQAVGSAETIPGVIETVSPTTAVPQELLIEARLKVPGALQEQVRPGGSGLVSSQER